MRAINRLNKSPFIIKWWTEAIERGTPLFSNDKTFPLDQVTFWPEYARGDHPNWPKTMSVDLVWASFSQWLNKEYPEEISGFFTKTGFFTVFYRLTGAHALTTTINDGKKSKKYSVGFEPYEQSAMRLTHTDPASDELDTDT